jgi:hypothetical protein
MIQSLQLPNRTFLKQNTGTLGEVFEHLNLFLMLRYFDK